MLRDLGSTAISALHLAASNPCFISNEYARSINVDACAEQLQELVDDDRVIMDNYDKRNFLSWCCNELASNRQMFLTPHFHKSFDVDVDIADPIIL